jgi:hypothetical protein
MLREEKDKLRTVRKYLQITLFLKGPYPENIKSSQLNSMKTIKNTHITNTSKKIYG